MAILNNEYQYIGRTSGVSCDRGWNYYILLYAKTTGDIATGKHTVSVKMRLVCDVASTFYGYYTDGSVKVDGVSAIFWDGQQVPNSIWNTSSITEGGIKYPRWIDLKEGTAVVDIGYGAAKDVKIDATWHRNSINSTPPGWLPYTTQITASITVTLPMIASASTITSAGDVTLGNACSVTWTPQAASFRYKLKFAIGDWSYTTGVIHPNKTTAYTYTGYQLPIEVANQVKTKTGTMTVTLYTYSDSNATAQIGSADSETFTVTVPENEDTRPTVSMVLAPVSELSAPFDSLYIQGKSKVQASLEFSLKYGATVDDSNITVDGVVYGTPYESGYLTKDGELSVQGFVKDSRGHTGIADGKITVIPYSKPIVQAASGESNIVAARCDSNGKLSDSGTYLKIKAKLIYEKVMSAGVQHNFGKIQYRYRAEGGLWSDWHTILDSTSSSDTEVTTGALLSGALSVKTNYQVQVQAVDNLTAETTPVTLILPSDDVYMDRPAGGYGMGLGGYCTGPGNFDVYWRTKARGGLSLFNEAGEELNLNSILPLPRGPLEDGWNPNDIANGVHEVSTYPLKDPMGNVLMETGVLIQLAATTDGFVKIQMAFPTDSFTPVYRIKFYTNWSDWLTFKI